MAISQSVQTQKVVINRIPVMARGVVCVIWPGSIIGQQNLAAVHAKIKKTSNYGIGLSLFGKSQEEHVSQYYAEINFFTTPYEVYELIKSPRKYNIATDGGAIPLKGSLGFVVANEDGTVLLSCYGQPSGNDPLSFRAEICALLAAAKLLQLITEYYDNKIQCEEPARGKIQVYTDSLTAFKL
ncbi:hypothetical protein FRACYDRAFT_245185 [Fragilariopsis cylindrus CCMP1102]|uniref:RNase H type-1 domain-containing protein n=1 Tax=Fragilariopsis cylindrus CCMP1102 TaxID=635003 RepID=A0A1E7F006_9STRA|nr:hypothetical protein FRACYDRAFT_245185 [Fragilariopsis cylindrus CCMP1102]|eukprot:OEU11446.1 hypothetical protein FRACYDRAFT_245185 [Fragilariopsis cylindrus CCMP1102]